MDDYLDSFSDKDIIQFYNQRRCMYFKNRWILFTQMNI